MISLAACRGMSIRRSQYEVKYRPAPGEYMPGMPGVQLAVLSRTLIAVEWPARRLPRQCFVLPKPP